MAGELRDVAERRAERLHDDLLHIRHAIDQYAEGERAEAHDHRKAWRRGWTRAFEAEQFGEVRDVTIGQTALSDVKQLRRIARLRRNLGNEVARQYEIKNAKQNIYGLRRGFVAQPADGFATARGAACPRKKESTSFLKKRSKKLLFHGRSLLPTSSVPVERNEALWDKISMLLFLKKRAFLIAAFAVNDNPQRGYLAAGSL